MMGDGPAPGRIPGLVGAYRLYLFADSGERASAGGLVLERRSEEAAPSGTVEDPLVGPPPLLTGFAEIDLARVGAAPGGDPASRAVDAPGAGLYAFASGGIVVRLGSQANRRDAMRFDGAHTTLEVLSIEPDRFGGRWTSDAGLSRGSGGFCAVRARP